MPTYEYECTECGHHFELFQNISEPKKTECPECQGTLRRLLGTGAGLLFKGSGFYQTDYRSESYKQGASAEKKSSDKKSDSASSSKSDSSSGSSTSSSTAKKD